MNHTLKRFTASSVLLLFTLIVFLVVNPTQNIGQIKIVPMMQDNFGNLHPLTIHEDIGSGKLISIPVAHETNHFQMNIGGELILKVLAPASKTNVTVRVGESLKTIIVINRDKTNVLQAKESGRIETSMLTVSDRPTIVLLRIFLSTNVIEAIKPGFYSTSPETIQIERRNIPGTTNAIYNFVIGFRDGSNEIEIATLQKAK